MCCIHNLTVPQLSLRLFVAKCCNIFLLHHNRLPLKIIFSFSKIKKCNYTLQFVLHCQYYLIKGKASIMLHISYAHCEKTRMSNNNSNSLFAIYNKHTGRVAYFSVRNNVLHIIKLSVITKLIKASWGIQSEGRFTSH